MLDLTPNPTTLEPIERASRNEIAALQLERMKWSLRHAYENVELYRKRFTAHGVHPDDLKSLEDLRRKRGGGTHRGDPGPRSRRPRAFRRQGETRHRSPTGSLTATSTTT